MCLPDIVDSMSKMKIKIFDFDRFFWSFGVNDKKVKLSLQLLSGNRQK